MEYAGFCQELSNLREPIPGWKSTDYYFCLVNTGLAMFIAMMGLFFAALYLLRIRRNIKNNLLQAYEQSIFQYLDGSRPYLGKFLYILMAYGSFLVRPLSYTIMYLTRKQTEELGRFLNIFLSTLLASVTGALYFFTDVFMANFYGIKAEIIRDKGDPYISVDERELFLKMVLRRSLTFGVIFFFGSMMNVVFGSPYFSLCETNAEFSYEWMTRMITSSFILVVLINRLNYIRITKRMQENCTLKRKKLHDMLSFCRHLEEYSYKPEMLPEVLRNLRSHDEDSWIREFTDIITQKQAQSAAIFDETTKILSNSHAAYQPILRNPMESHITGVAWLVVNLLDAAYNTVAAPLFIFSGTEKKEFRFTLLMIILVLYCIECTLQAYLVKRIVSTKASFGDHLQGRDTLQLDQRNSEKRKEDLQQDSYFELSRHSVSSDIPLTTSGQKFHFSDL